jgi:DNA-binding NtrC family response regulator
MDGSARDDTGETTTMRGESVPLNTPPVAVEVRDDAEFGPLFDPKLVEDAVVLVVDDEALITNSLRHFFELELGLRNVVTWNSPVEAVEWASRHRVDMTITDFLMPELDGLALLREIRRLHPEATRILLTGYADKANAIRAINEVALFQYIEKPWDSDRLAAVVRSGLEHMALQRTLRGLIERLGVEKRQREHLRRALIRAFA